MIRSCLLQYSYSFKSENNCCSVYMNKTFYGHTPNVNDLLNLDRLTYLWHYCLGHIGVKHIKKLHVDGLLESLDYESFDT